jgi:alcohol/geraniol dehydrogenase (NADP+)
MKVSAYAANGPHEKLKPFSYEMGELGNEQVDIGLSTAESAIQISA